MRAKPFSVFVCLFLIATTLHSQSRTPSIFYVSPSGLDTNPGTISQPWLTIQKAANDLLAGDTVLIRGGTYHEVVIPQNSGTAGNLISYRAYNGEIPIIDGTGVTLPAPFHGIFHLEERHYIVISGLHMINVGPGDNHAGILVDLCTNITIENCTTYNTASSGIGVWGSSQVVVSGNKVELACNDGEQECISIGSTDSAQIYDNWVLNSGPGTNGGEGICLKDGSSNLQAYGNLVETQHRIGIYVDAWNQYTHHIDVYNNIIRNNFDDGLAVASETGGLLEYIRIFNNLVFNNAVNGLTIAGWGEPIPAHPMNEVVIINNTFFNNGGTLGWGGGIVQENPDVTNITIRNNIFSNNVYYQILVEQGPPPSADHNLIHGFRGMAGEIYGLSYVEGDPLFINAGGENFRLATGSPAIDMGSLQSAPALDYDGNPRPFGPGVDIGAFEQSTDFLGSLPAWPIPNSVIELVLIVNQMNP